MSELHIIAAIDRNRAIGFGGDMVYHLSADLKRFKALTLGYPVVMGRRTFESLPKGALPGRRNIVITRNAAYSAPNIETAPSLEAALALCSDAEKTFIIGGGEIYSQALPLADVLDLTEIDDAAPDADTFFPPFDKLFILTNTEPALTTPPASFNTYHRR